MPKQLSFESLIAPIQAIDVRKTLYTILQRFGIKTTTWQPGDPTRTTLQALSVLHSAYTYWASNAIRMKFLQLAKGDWARATAKYDYGTEGYLAQPAAGNVIFSNATGADMVFAPEDVTVRYTKTNADQSTSTYTYHNTAAFTVPAGGSFTSGIEADSPGRASTLPAGAAVTLSPAINGLTVSIPSTLLGQDDESIQSLVNRALLAHPATSRLSPSEVYQDVALKAKNPDGSLICGKVRVVPGNPVRVLVESISGGIIPGDRNDINTPLGRLNIAIQTQAVTQGVTAVVENVIVLVVALTYTAYVRKDSQYSDDQVKDLIASSLYDTFNEFPIGGFELPLALVDGTHPAGSHWIFVDALKAAVENPTGPDTNVVNPVFKAVVSTDYAGSGDLLMGDGVQVQLGPISATVVRV